MMIHLVDNDIALKICQYDLVSEFATVVNGLESVYLLSTLKYRFHLKDVNKALKRCGNIDIVNRLQALANQTKEISTPPNIELLSALGEVNQIDSGEAILFALGGILRNSLTLTGDKRSLTALSKAVSEGKLPNLYVGRLKCFEQVIAEILLSHDEELIINKVNGHSWDKALYNCFGASMLSTSAILEGLRSYYNYLNDQCLNMLAPFPNV